MVPLIFVSGKVVLTGAKVRQEFFLGPARGLIIFDALKKNIEEDSLNLQRLGMLRLRNDQLSLWKTFIPRLHLRNS